VATVGVDVRSNSQLADYNNRLYTE